ncbi:alkylation response protein AidB-like acyl-CoA dehydrogenase [Neorhizobium galegae]|uniref:acyl-CoA dehydrogenase n=1 Tax=Neorhizobium galegae TaxID=399 RepID=UPI001EC2FD14|nr:acyl-CoA dehydrogenase family protein [Neorhizobium galegae]MBP2561569.1 alkylation response protein AidB-like acyl-CoA dehydrogenase [Neorhizobium galegae]
MDLNYSDEQLLLKESAERFLKDRYDFEKRTRILASETGFDAGIWSEMADLGWLALPFAEENGGLGGGAVEISLIMEAIGRTLVVEPYLASVILAGGLVEKLGSEEQKAEILGQLIAGTSRPALAHAERRTGVDLGNIAATGTKKGENYVLSGEKPLVLGGPFADIFIVSARLGGNTNPERAIGLFAVPANAAGLTRTEVKLVDGSRASDLVLDNVSVPASALLDADADTLAEIEAAYDRANAALSFETVGIMDALMDATVAYTKERVQFGKPLASFQALQHRMGEMAVKCQEARGSALLATLSVDAPRPMRIRGVSGARAKIGKVSRSVAQEAIQLHGAMGFSEEMPIGAWFRRLYAIENTFGTTADHLKRYGEIIRDTKVLSGSLLRTGDTDQPELREGMNLRMTEEEVRFRDEARAFLENHLDEDLKRAERLNPSFLADPAIGLKWQAKLNDKGWVAPSWPKQYGGTGWTLAERYIFDQECERAGEPHFRGASIKMIAPVIMRYGNDAQKDFYLPRILSGEDVWAQGYSEPGSGSDLASLKTKAVLDGDHYVVNGSKIWSTLAHHATRMFALVRTADTGKKQEGITFILIDLKSPGVTIRPIRSICGTHEFNQVFFDDVKVPVSDRIGEEGEGWDIAKYLLEFERGGAFAGGVLRSMLARLHRLASEPLPDGRKMFDDPLFMARFAEIATDVDANDMLELAAMSKVQAGGNPGSVPSSTMKIERSRIRQSIAELAASILGPDALRWEQHRPLHELPEEAEIAEERKVASAVYFNSRSQSIFGGSNEIQLEIIAKTLLR